MNNTAIRVEGLSKRYRIGGRQARYKTLRDSLIGVASAPFRAIRSAARRANGQPSAQANGNNLIWALKDISLDRKSVV